MNDIKRIPARKIISQILLDLEVYARADSEKKRIALESTYSNRFPNNFPKWEDDDDLMEWLKRLC